MTTNELEPLDTAAIMAIHCPTRGPDPLRARSWCDVCSGEDGFVEWPCLPHLQAEENDRLAAENAALRAAQQRVRETTIGWRRGAGKLKHPAKSAAYWYALEVLAALDGDQ